MLGLSLSDYESYCFDEAVAYFDMLHENEMYEKSKDKGSEPEGGSKNGLDMLLNNNFKQGRRK